MSINANQLVNIIPRIVGGASANLETIGNVLTKNPLIPSGQLAIEFANAAAVGDYFGGESDEFKFANQYFAGFINQTKGISSLVISRRVDTAAAAWIRGAKVTATLGEFKSITAGGFTITINGIEKTVADIDLSECTSLSEVATEVATSIGGVTGAYSTIHCAFTFTTVATGATATIGYAVEAAGGTLATMLGITAESGAVLSQGMDAMTVAENMNKVAAATRNWVGLTTLYELTKDEVEALSAWVDIDDDYCLFAWSTDVRITNPQTFPQTIFADLDNYNCTAVIYGDQQDCAFLEAVGAGIDWNRIQGLVTWFGKRTSGLNPRVSLDQTAAVLNDLRVNYIGDYAARNSEFKLLNRGCLTGDFYSWIDTLYAMIWLKSALQTAIMDGLTSVGRAPYNERGYSMVRAWMLDPINAGVRNGIIDAGMELSEAQKNQLMNEVGEDISQDLFSKGWWLRIDDPGSVNRSQRDTPTVYLVVCNAGAIQRVEFPLTMAV